MLLQVPSKTPKTMCRASNNIIVFQKANLRKARKPVGLKQFEVGMICSVFRITDEKPDVILFCC
jgi:hypothetical protein